MCSYFYMLNVCQFVGVLLTLIVYINVFDDQSLQRNKCIAHKLLVMTWFQL